jgi:hypothetical protein
VDTPPANRRARRDGRPELTQPWYSCDVWPLDDLASDIGWQEFERRFGLGPDDRPEALSGLIAVTYGFLFPEHRQARAHTAIPPEDDPYSGDYEGDWCHFAVLARAPDANPEDLEADDFVAENVAFGQRWRGTLADFEEFATERMMLRPWSSLLVFDDHPVVVAAKGTHNLHPHDPPLGSDGKIDLQWIDFGKSNSAPIDDFVSDAVEQPYSSVLAAKVLAGAALGGGLGGILGGIAGAIVGAIAAAAEAANAEEEGLWETPKLDPSPPPDPPGEDPISEDAVDLAKSSLAKPLSIGNPPFFDPSVGESRDWLPEPDQALVDGSLLLDRSRRNGPPAFTGRWGVRCDADRIMLRTGIKLPSYRLQIMDALLVEM